MAVRMCGFCIHSQRYKKRLIWCCRPVDDNGKGFTNCDAERDDIDDGRCGPAANFYMPRIDKYSIHLKIELLVIAPMLRKTIEMMEQKGLIENVQQQREDA